MPHDHIPANGGEPRSHRLRLYPITPEFLLSLMGRESDVIRITRGRLPADTRLLDVTWDFHRHTFLMKVESEEFAEVPEGTPIPLDWDVCFLRVEPVEA
jgi:hypothetical protein